ncbi:MAG: S1 family peptidase [Actinomycetota bacterium]|nr:S1 family peptidase [Actinomycetota bacterium]
MLPRSRARSLAAAALGVLLSVGVALPASASPAVPEPLSQQPVGAESGLAAQQLAREAAASGIESTLRAALGTSFAGAWFEPGTSDLIVATTDAAATQRVRAAGAQPRLVSRDLLALERVMAVLNSRAGSVVDTVTGWYVDPASNSVVVSVTDEVAAKAFTAGQDAVRIEHVDARPLPLADLHGGDKITTSEGGHCSVGFNAISGNTRYIITAGHCTKLGGTWAGPDGSPIGPVAKSSFPGYDFGLVEVAAESWEQTRDVYTDSGYLTMTGTEPVAIGSSICRSGATSGYHCGRVEAVNETVNYGSGDVVRGLTRTDICAEAGDSGGPFVSGTQAQGTLSGGSGGCLLGGQSYFQPVREVLSTYGLTLLTGEPSRDNS